MSHHRTCQLQPPFSVRVILLLEVLQHAISSQPKEVDFRALLFLTQPQQRALELYVPLGLRFDLTFPKLLIDFQGIRSEEGPCY